MGGRGGTGSSLAESGTVEVGGGMEDKTGEQKCRDEGGKALGKTELLRAHP